jgi:D-alanyl-lipoteichoic acid acyltransferase DltB (MBOAT superfamily)
MLFNSVEFLVYFLPIVWLGWRLVSLTRNRGLAIGWLSLSSLAFYAYWNWHYAPLLVISLAVNFAIGRSLQARPRRWLLALGLIWNLGFLGYFKYFNFFIANVDALTALDWPLRKIILPLGISFFTFQKIAFLVDAWRGKLGKIQFGDFALFVLFFPQLIAGPIVHHQDFIPQLSEPAWLRFNPQRFARGLILFSTGLFCKTVIADTLAPIADSAFGLVGAEFNLRLVEAWIGVLAYGLQLFYDFAGYSYMALGLALLFGLTLPVNFFGPYASRSIIEFWRRWHITLSAFLRDYVYIPLGGNRHGFGKQIRNLLITFLLAGIWHGAGWTFALWGLWHGVALAINHLWRRAHPRAEAREKTFSFGSLLLTTLVVQTGWVLFRAPNFRVATDLAASLLGLHGISVPIGLTRWVDALAPVVRPQGWFPNLYVTPSRLAVFFLSGALAVVGPTLLAWFGCSNADVAAPPPIVRDYLPAQATLPTWWQAAIAGGMLALSVAALSRSAPFLYFQF